MAHKIDTSEEQYRPIGVEPKLDRTGTQKTDRDQTLLWTVHALHQPVSGKPTVISVTVPAASSPILTPMAPAVWTGLRVDIWQSGESSGLWFAADAVASVANRRSE